MIRINNKADEAEIYISGDIVDDSSGEFYRDWDGNAIEGYIWPKQIKEQLDAIADDKPVTVYINSDGGSVPAGVAMANMLARHSGETTAVVDGWCCSIATQIFFSCDKREIPANAYLMIHKPASFAFGNADDLIKVAESLDVIQKGLESTYKNAALPGITEEKIHDLVNGETWLTGEDAAELFTVTVTAPSQQVACFGAGKRYMNRIPAAINFVAPAPKVKAEDKAKKEKLEKQTAFIKTAIAAAEGIE